MNKQAASKSNQNILNKRIPTNPKFNHVKPVVDTGASLSKHVDKINAMKSDFKYKSDEIFIRIKITTLVQLIIDVLHLSHMNVSSVQDSRNYDEIEDANKDQSEKVTGPMEAKFISVVHGLGEMDLNQSNLIKHEKSDEPLPYLLLDVRHDDSFKQCRIKSAQNYPASMLNRSVNYETKELLQYKNKTDKVIIIYDENETIASVVSTTLVQRGYDNVFMLSGGLKFAVKLFPKSLIFGKLPESCSLKTSSIQKKRNSFETKNDSNIRFAENQEFSHEDLETLQEQLDHHLNKSSSYGTSMISSSRPTSSKSFRSTSSLSKYSLSSTYSKPKPWK